MNKKIVIIIIVILFILGSKMIVYKRHKVEGDKIKSVNLSTDYEVKQVLEDVEALGVNTVNVPIVIEIPHLTSNEMKINEYSKDKAIQLITLLKRRQIKIILEAYPWINNGSAYETEYDPFDKQQFFKDWKAVLETLIDDLANPYDVDIMIIASNFEKLELYEDDWCNIIALVKNKFKGLVTYKTSWWYSAKWDHASIERYHKKLNNKVFSQVDFIAIAAYFELSDQPENTVEELVSCLSATTINDRNQNIVHEIYQFYEKYNKPIFFGELGFPRRNYAAAHPWDSLVSDIENDKEQARCFEAYRKVFEKVDYIKGFSVFAAGKKDKDKIFYPSKETIDVIRSWYNPND